MTRGEAAEILDNWAAENPLGALRDGIAQYVTPHRVDAMALAEPEAALVYAYDRLTPERRAWCERQAKKRGFDRFVPDRLAPERKRALAEAMAWIRAAEWTPPDRAEPITVGDERPRQRARTRQRTAVGYIIPCALCRTEFRAGRADARFCSARCRQKASRAGRRGSPDDASQEAGIQARGYL